MLKRTREILNLCKANALTIVSMDNQSRGGWKLRLRAPNGTEDTFYLLQAPDGAVAHREAKAIKSFALCNPMPALAQAFAKASIPPQPKEPATMTLNTQQPALPQIEAKVKEPPARTKGSGEYTKHALTHNRFFQLCMWLNTAVKGQEDMRKRTQVQLAELAAKDLGFPISPSSIGSALKSTGITLTGPAAKPAKAAGVPEEDFRELLLLVNLIRNKVGISGTEAWGKLLAKYLEK